MKNIQFIFLFTIVCGLQQAVFAQKWCEPGAEWIMSEDYHYMRYHYQKDTIYEGVPCKKIQALRINPDQCKDTVAIENKSIYTYAQNDIVWFYYEDAFYPTYFFNAQVGDTLVVKNFMPFHDPDCDSTLIQIVDSVGTTTLFGDTLRFYMYTFKPRDFISDLKVFVIEKLGIGYLPMSNSSFGEPIQPYHACLAGVKRVRTICYNDSLFSFREDPNKDCSTCLPMNIEKSIEEAEQKIKIYPNPTTTHFTLQSTQNIQHIQVFDLRGALVLEQTVQSTAHQVQLSEAGTYIIHIHLQDGSTERQKVVKMKE
jgi:hypothetical protein